MPESRPEQYEKAKLAVVHERLGLGIDFQTFADGTIEIRWRRDYDGEWSDERFAQATSFTGALIAILEHENAADLAEAREVAGA